MQQRNSWKGHSGGSPHTPQAHRPLLFTLQRLQAWARCGCQDLVGLHGPKQPHLRPLTPPMAPEPISVQLLSSSVLAIAL